MEARGVSVAGRLALAGVVLVAVGLGWPAPVAAQPVWSPEAVALAIGDVSEYEDTIAVAMDDDGNAVAAWRGSQPGLRLFASRYSALGRTWSAPTTLSYFAFSAGAPSIVMDASGNATVAWEEAGLRAAHYSVATGTWSEPVQVVPFTVSYRCWIASHRMVADRTGHVLFVWTAACNLSGIPYSSVRYARYTPATGAVEGGTLADVIGGRGYATADIAVDGLGNAVALWGESSDTVLMRAAYYTAATNAWSAPVTALAGPIGATVIGPRIAIDAAGNVLAVWRLEGVYNAIRAARLDRITLSWGQVTDLFPASSLNIFTPPEIAVDPAGNGIAIWKRRDGETVRLQVALYEADDGTWSTALDLTPSGLTGGSARVEFDGFGNATAVWWQGDGTRAVVRAGRVSPESRTTLTDLATLEQAAVPLALGVSAGGSATVLWTSVTEGVATLQASTWRATPPGVPTSLAVTAQSGRVLTLRWVPPIGGGTPTGYVLSGGTLPGEVLASIPTGSLLPTFTFTAPSGVCYLKLHAVTEGVWGPPSNEIRVAVEVSATPSAPAQLLAAVNGTDVTLSWKNTFMGGPPTGIVLTTLGPANFSLALPVGEMFSATNVSPGTYTIAMKATNAAGESPYSNAVTLTVPATCGERPNVPENFTATASGRAFDVAWSPPSSGAAVTGYIVSVSGSWAGSIATTGRTLSGTAAPGTYGLSVQATNACGVGWPAAVRIVVVPRD
jgi:hypothetical protein